MKDRRSLLPLLLAGLTAGCASAPEVAPAPTYAERSAAVLNAVAPQVAGRWTLMEVQYKRRPYFQYPASLPRDTILHQFATLTLAPVKVPRTSRNGRPEFEGELTYGSKTYPVYFSLTENSDRVLRNQGPPVSLLLEYNFPVSTHQTEPEEQFLQDIGLIGENFSLEAEAGQRTMRWEGYNRHLKSIIFTR